MFIIQLTERSLKMEGQYSLSMLVVVASSSSLALLFFYLGARAFYSVWWKPKRLERQLIQQGVRGNPYRRLYGDLKEEAQQLMEAWSRPMDQLNHKIVPRVLPFANNMAQKYGKLCLIWVGTTPYVVIREPEMIREILSNKSGQLRKPPVSPLLQSLTKGLSSLEGEEWANRRRIIAPAFHLEKLKGMVPAFATSCSDLIKRWDELAGVVEGSFELDVWPEFQNLTGDVISRTAFGSSFEEGKRIHQLQKEQTELAMEAARVPYIPGFKYIPTAKNKRRLAVDREIKSILGGMIGKKLRSMSETKLGSASNDLLGLLVQLASDSKNKTMSMEDVIEECKLFYFAGQETTSTWTVILLSMHPIWQQRAREEVLRTCGGRDHEPDFDSMSQLKTVTMILYEVLRLYPPVVSLLCQTYGEIKLGGVLSVPAGVGLLMPTLLIHHDPEYWGEDAEEFNPERFSEGVSKASKGGKSAFYPFGWGPRVCLGQSFAMMEAKMALATILQCFSFELSPAYAHAPYVAMTLQPQHGAHVVLHRL